MDRYGRHLNIGRYTAYCIECQHYDIAVIFFSNMSNYNKLRPVQCVLTTIILGKFDHISSSSFI